MHDCQRFREDWAAGCADENPSCQECRHYCEDAAAVFQVVSVPRAIEPSEEYLEGFDSRLRERLILANPSPTFVVWKWATLAAAAASIAIVLSWAGFPNGTSTPPGRIEFVDDHIRGLDPAVVDFLGQSELFLRSFTKIKVSDTEDLDDAQAHARRDLAGIGDQKQAAGDFAPVRITLEEYESILREIKNLDSVDDLADVQMRIHRNGLIANLKAYQPRAVLVSRR
jgi:hypothetical protein